MILVALADLATDVEAEAPLLAKDLGLSVYEARLLVAGERPKVVLRTSDEARAQALVAKLRERRHGAFACDAGEIVATDDMPRLGAFSLGDAALRSGAGEELPYSDLLAIVRAMHVAHSTRKKTVSEHKLALGRAVLTGGLVNTKKTTREVTVGAAVHEQLVYLLRRSGAPAWVVEDGSTSFGGLGTKMAPSAAENLLRLVGELRRRAPDAAYDERLLRARGAGDMYDDRLDERVHLLGLAIGSRANVPYR